MRLINSLVLLLAFLLITACSDADKEHAGGAKPAATGAAEHSSVKTPALRPVVMAAKRPANIDVWLRDRVPNDALFYLRLPNTWNVIGGYVSGDKKAARSAAYAKASRAIRAAFAENILPEIPERFNIVLALLLQHTVSPIEAVGLAPGNPNSPLPRVLLTVATDFADVAAVQSFFDALAEGSRVVQVTRPVTATTDGIVTVAGMPMLVRFDEPGKRLFIYTGDAPDSGLLDNMLAQFVRSGVAPQKALEQSIDTSGQGLFIWINVAAVIDRSLATPDNPVLAKMKPFGLDQIKSIALGAGSAGGLGRLKFVIEMPRVGFRDYLPVVDIDIDLAAAGEPDFVVLLGLPGPSDLVAFETALAGVLPAEKMQSYIEKKNRLEEVAGFGIADLVQAFGQEVLLISDAAGIYSAVRVRDRQAYTKLLANATEHFGLVHQTRDINGRTFHHLIVPSLSTMVKESVEKKSGPLPESRENKMPRLVERFLKLPGHFYWIEEGDYLLQASVPQTLIDRDYIASRVAIGSWLKQEQKTSGDDAFFLASIRHEDLPSLLYQLDLGLLQMLGDYVGQPVDLLDFPSARELGLPKGSTYFLKIASSDTQLSFEMGYAHNPLEFMFQSSGFAGIVVVGVLAAVAIPAYQDYTLRARVVAGIANAEPLKLHVLKSLLDNKRSPNAEEIKGFNFESRSNDYSLHMEPETGVIRISFTIEQLGPDARVALVPEIVEQKLGWSCRGAMQQKYLPKTCRE